MDFDRTTAATDTMRRPVTRRRMLRVGLALASLPLLAACGRYRQSFVPFGVISMHKPPPSATRYNLARGFSALLALSVSMRSPEMPG